MENVQCHILSQSASKASAQTSCYDKSLWQMPGYRKNGAWNVLTPISTFTIADKPAPVRRNRTGSLLSLPHCNLHNFTSAHLFYDAGKALRGGARRDVLAGLPSNLPPLWDPIPLLGRFFGGLGLGFLMPPGPIFGRWVLILDFSIDSGHPRPSTKGHAPRRLLRNGGAETARSHPSHPRNSSKLLVRQP